MKMTTRKPVVLVVNSVYAKAKDVFNSVTNLEIVTVPADEDTLSKIVKEKEAFAVVLNVDNYTDLLYKAMPKGGVIARYGVGYDNINVKKAIQNDLFVTNTPDVLDSTVAEYTVFLAGALLRRIGKAEKEISQGSWGPVMGNELKGKVWAILGLGNIGRELSKILTFGFGIKVIALKKNSAVPEKVREECGVEKISSDYSKIAPFADIVSLHLPANEETYHFLNRTRLEQLKPGTVLINTGRGSLINEDALYSALINRRILGAGLDVFENEPYKPVNPNKDLRELSNVVLTPHIASSALECCNRMAERVIQNIGFALEEKYERMDIVLE